MKEIIEMKGKTLSLFITLLVTAMLVSCGKKAPLKDGVYTSESAGHRVGHSKIILEVKDQKIAKVTFLCYDKKGNIKDKEYGKKSGNAEFYQRAQEAVKGMRSYEQQINEKKELEAVDAVSGATISFRQFNEAMELALEKARGN